MTLLIRADAGRAIGTGHVMRCFALAQEWQRRGGAVRVVMAEGVPGLAQRARHEGFDVVEAPEQSEDADVAATLDEAQRCDARWVAVDGYRFSGVFARALRDSRRRVLQLDDYGHTGRVTADLLLNQNLYARESAYPDREEYAELLLGPAYVLLRREFRGMRGRRREVAPHAGRVLVTLGGSDPDNVTARVMLALSGLRIEGLRVIVLIGGANPHRGDLLAMAAGDPRFEMRVDTREVHRLMEWADVAVLTGGTTCWEAMCSGLPFVVMAVTEHQVAVMESIDRAGVARSLGRYADRTDDVLAGTVAALLGDQRERGERAARGQALIDGYGVERVCDAMLRERRREDEQQSEHTGHMASGVTDD